MQGLETFDTVPERESLSFTFCPFTPGPSNSQSSFVFISYHIKSNYTTKGLHSVCPDSPLLSVCLMLDTKVINSTAGILLYTLRPFEHRLKQLSYSNGEIRYSLMFL